MSVRILNEYCRLLLTGHTWRKLTTTSIYQSSKKWSNDEKEESKEKVKKVGLDGKLKNDVESVIKNLPDNETKTDLGHLNNLLDQNKYTAGKQESKQKKNKSMTSILQSSKKWSNDEIDESKKITNKIDLDDNIKTAVNSVAKILPGEQKETEWELLNQLLHQNKYAAEKQQKKSSSVSSSNLLSNMTIKQFVKRSRGEHLDDDAPPISFNNRGRAISSQYELFDGPGLDIFSPTPEQSSDTIIRSYDRKQTLRHQLEQEDMNNKSVFSPNNAFEEMIKWTKEQKLWTFPINNEGMKEEEDVGFHEHVFLEDQIEDFPQKGPIRHFMELVLVGLSKNPYLTVQQKHEHIDWFRQYFKEKESVLKESLGEAHNFSQLKQ